MSSVSPRELRVLLQARCPGLIHELVPNCRREGNVLSCPNPLRANDRHGSFKVWSNGAWKEYDSGEKGDILGLLAYVAGISPTSREGRRYAIDEAKKILGLTDGNPRRLASVKLFVLERQKKQAEEEVARAIRIRARVSAIISEARILRDLHDRSNWAVRYLLDRGIDPALVQNRSTPLMLHPNLNNWVAREWTGPALVSPVCQRDGSSPGVHCVFLAERDGRIVKAPLPSAKLMLGTVKGGVVPISSGPSGTTLGKAWAAGISGPVILCEGRETGEALAIGAPDARVWACLSLGNIAQAPVNHAGVTAIVVALENDQKNEAIRMRERVFESLQAHGRPVVAMKPHVGSDFADVLAHGARDQQRS